MCSKVRRHVACGMVACGGWHALVVVYASSGRGVYDCALCLVDACVVLHGTRCHRWVMGRGRGGGAEQQQASCPQRVKPPAA